MKLIPDSLRKHGNATEVAGLVLLVLAALSAGALVSYDSADPLFFFKAQLGEPGNSNWVGRVGATMAEALLQTLGTVAFVFPLGLAVLGWRRLKPSSTESTYPGLTGYLALALTLCTLLDLMFGSIAFRGQVVPAGGLMGNIFAGILVALVNVTGAILITLTVLTAAVVLISRFSFVRSVELSARWLGRSSADGDNQLVR